MANSSNDNKSGQDKSRESPFPTSDSMAGKSGSGANAGEAAKGSADEMLERVVEGAHKMVDRVAERAAPAVERLKHTVDGAAETVHSQTDRIHAAQEEWIDATRACVRNHPLTSIGVAVLAGMVLSKMMSSR
jgi:ElaB/YqjD/DUF883 family membrane-anchored ribosome-binding protein